MALDQMVVRKRMQKKGTFCLSSRTEKEQLNKVYFSG